MGLETNPCPSTGSLRFPPLLSSQVQPRLRELNPQDFLNHKDHGNIHLPDSQASLFPLNLVAILTIAEKERDFPRSTILLLSPL